MSERIELPDSIGVFIRLVSSDHQTDSESKKSELAIHTIIAVDHSASNEIVHISAYGYLGGSAWDEWYTKVAVDEFNEQALKVLEESDGSDLGEDTIFSLLNRVIDRYAHFEDGVPTLKVGYVSRIESDTSFGRHVSINWNSLSEAPSLASKTWPLSLKLIHLGW